MITHVHFNGKLIPSAEASLKVNDLAILRGYGIFDYMLFQRRTPLFLKDYIKRFFRSAKFMHLKPPCSKKELAGFIQEVIDTNHLEDGAIRLLMTGGYSEDGYNPGEPNLFVLQHPYPNHPDERYTTGVKVIAHDYMRDLPEVKSINYTQGIFLAPMLKKAGAIEPLYHNNGLVTEAVRSNVFAVFGKKRLVTPSSGILMGITRRKVMEVARNYYEVEEIDLTLEELLKADEVFLTGSSKGIMPVVTIDNTRIGSGEPGKVTQHIMEAFDNLKVEYLSNPMIRG